MADYKILTESEVYSIAGTAAKGSPTPNLCCTGARGAALGAVIHVNCDANQLVDETKVYPKFGGVVTGIHSSSISDVPDLPTTYNSVIYFSTTLTSSYPTKAVGAEVGYIILNNVKLTLKFKDTQHLDVGNTGKQVLIYAAGTPKKISYWNTNGAIVSAICLNT